MEKQISIIIPTYNMEAYIGKCLDSLLIPEFDAVEVLVVNDGSRDRSSEIAHTYADRYPASIRVIDKPNGNYGSCINAALPLATGRYVKVLDADDTFDTAAFSRFVQMLPDIDTDLILTSFYTVNEADEITSERDASDFSIVPEKITDITKNKLEVFPRFVSMHRITYNRDIFTRFDYSQIEGVSYSDAQWSIQPLSFCNSVYLSNLFVYRYLLGRVGQTVDPKIVSKSIPQSFKVLDRLVDDISPLNGTMIDSSFYLMQVVKLHRPNYLTALNGSASTYSILKQHDLKIRKLNIQLYEQVGNLGHENLAKFKFINLLRKHEYSYPFKIPTGIRILMAVNNLENRIKGLINK